MLANLQIKSATPKATPYKLTDRDGLSIVVFSGTRFWRYNYLDPAAGKARQRTLSGRVVVA